MASTQPKFRSEMYEKFKEDLSRRVEWEKKLARVELQRFAQDRPRINNHPWPKSSNVRYPLSNSIIGQQKPYFFKVLFASEDVCTFRGLTALSARYNLHVAKFFHFITTQKTDFEREIQYALDKLLQDGECIVKVMWDSEKRVPYYQWVDNLYFITPWNSTEIEGLHRMVHVIQISPERVKKKFGHLSGIDDFIESAKEGTRLENDTIDREKLRYDRQGINRSSKYGQIVLWETHYEDEEGNKRICTISPENNKFDFEDDRAYPYDHGEWMFCHHRREYVDRSMHSARGIPELVQEGEHSLTAMWRNKHNAMTLYNAPIFYAPNGSEGSTNNMGFVPGQLVPFAIQKVDLGQPPISWDEEMANTRTVFERMSATPDFGIGRGNAMDQARTKYEVQQIANVQGLSADLDTSNWKSFIGRAFRQAWHLTTQFKPDNLVFFMKNEATEIPPEALTNDYLIEVSGSAEAVNKEFMVQKAAALWQQSINNPYANGLNIWTNFVEKLEPGRVQDFVIDPQAQQDRAKEKALNEISIMITTKAQLVAKPGDDFGTNAMTAMQYLQNAQNTGDSLNPIQLKLISNYIASQREALKHTDIQKYAQLNEALNQMDQQHAQQMQQAAAQKLQSAGMIGAGAPRGMAPVQSQPPQIPNGSAMPPVQ